MKFLYVLLLFSASLQAQISGCTDPLSLNYNSGATVNNGNCQYAATQVVPLSTSLLAQPLSETSGLCFSEGFLVTHNDSFDDKLYTIDLAGAMISEASTGLPNLDWEEMSEDGDFYYLGDFGNNATGNRADLRIFKIPKNGQPAEVIGFQYEDQTSAASQPANSTEFDCEALVVIDDKIFLFTKKWNSQTTSVYEISNSPGNHTAILKSTFNINGLVTGAAFIESKQLIVLCGYSTSLSPFIYLLYDYNPDDFFSGNKRRIDLNLPLHQIEAIASVDGEQFYITNEKFVMGSMVNIPAKLHRLDLSEFTGAIGNNALTQLGQIKSNFNCAYDSVMKQVSFDGAPDNTTFQMYDMLGNKVISGKGFSPVDVSTLSCGVYFMTFFSERATQTHAIAIY